MMVHAFLRLRWNIAISGLAERPQGETADGQVREAAFPHSSANLRCRTEAVQREEMEIKADSQHL